MFEQVLYDHLVQNTADIGCLATYNGLPAVFNREAPADTDTGWDGAQYGRLIFTVSMQGSYERIVDGTLTVDLILKDGEPVPEDVAPQINDLIDGYFFTDEYRTIAAQWFATNYLYGADEQQNGIRLTYRILAFPLQRSAEPDFISLVNSYTKEILPDACVIGLDTMAAPAWRPAPETPSVYWRCSEIRPCDWIPSNYACTWQTAICHAHISAVDLETERNTARKIVNSFDMKRSLRFPDNTVLRIDRNVSVAAGADPLGQGQVRAELTYGILRQSSGTTLDNIHMQ